MKVTELALAVGIIAAVVGPFWLVSGLWAVWGQVRTWRRTGSPPSEPFWSSRAMRRAASGAFLVADAMLLLLAPISGDWLLLAEAPFFLFFLTVWIIGTIQGSGR